METVQLPPFVLDIESRGSKDLEEVYLSGLRAPSNIKDPDKIQANIEKQMEGSGKAMAVDTDLNEIICIGIKVVGEDPIICADLKSFVEWYNEEVKMSETDIGRRTNGMRMMVTFNGCGFDIPVLIKQAIKQGIDDFPYQDFIKKMDKYKGKASHIDLMNEIGMVWGKNKSLDTYLQIYLGISKKEIDFATADVPEIVEHCIEDIENTEKLFMKFKKLWYID